MNSDQFLDEADIYHVLVVDDENAVRDFVERALNYAGYAVVAAENGQKALEELKKQKFDLLLTDIVMPELDGIALALKAVKEYPEMKILMMSGYANQRQRAHNLDVLAHEVISKPFTLEEITNKVTKTLES
jgi:DNA-binding response OmpR family regulator